MSVRVGTTVVSPFRSGGGGTSDYTDLTNKPKINNVELNGNKTSSDLGLQPAGNYLTSETDPVFTASASYGITSTDISNWNSKGTYSKPNSGIPDTDLASAVQTSLSKADTALQAHQDISGKEDKSNKVTSLSSSSTDTQYPSAKCVYDMIGDVETILTTLTTGSGV